MVKNVADGTGTSVLFTSITWGGTEYISLELRQGR